MAHTSAPTDYAGLDVQAGLVLRATGKWPHGWSKVIVGGAVLFWLTYALWLAAAVLGYAIGNDQSRELISDLGPLPISFASAAFAWRTSCTRDVTGMARPWRAIALALLMYSVGDALWLAYDIAGLTPFPSPATIGFFAFYPLALWGLQAFPLAPRTGIQRSTFLLDGTTVIVGGGMLVWHFVVHPLAMANAQDAWAVALAVAAPVGDMVLLLGVLTILLRGWTDTQRDSLQFLMLGVVVFGVADLVYGYATLQDAYRPGSLIDLLWPLAQLLILFGAFTARRQMWKAPSSLLADGQLTRHYVWLPYVAVAGAYSLLVAVAAHPDDADLPELIGGAVALTALVVARQAVAQRENGRLLGLAATRRTEARFRALVQHATDVISVYAPGGDITYQSPSISRVFGYTPGPGAGMDLTTVTMPEDAQRVQSFLKQAGRQQNGSISLDWRLRHEDGRERDVEGIAINLLDDPDIGGVVLTISDITERKALEEQLAHQAFHDALTGLANRALFQDRLTQGLRNAARHGSHIAVLYLDLDDFKRVNDSLGHAVGDQLLVGLGRRLRACIRPADTVARFGGDEFAVLLEDVHAVDEATATADRLLEGLHEPFDVGGHRLFVKTSIGIVVTHEANAEARDLVRDADLALYIESEMRRGLEADEFRVFYQPIVDLATGAVTEVEALVRWQHPTRGLLPPSAFIPVAEETGLIVRLGGWVLEQACRQAMEWERVVVGVNLSALQFQQADLVSDVRRVLADSGLPPERLKLEITESLAMQDIDATIHTLGELHALGATLAIDDFGTGYSSLSYLKQFPVDTLKIDKSFVDAIGHDSQDTAIVQSVVDLARSLSLSITAEGIETTTQFEDLRALGCDRGQDYLFGRPMPAEAVSLVLDARYLARAA